MTGQELREATLTHYDRMIVGIKLASEEEVNESLRNTDVYLTIKALSKESPAGDDCPLCRWNNLQMVYTLWVECDGCPVKRTTGVAQCKETPWQQIRTASSKQGILDALSAEREFLEGLDYE